MSKTVSAIACAIAVLLSVSINGPFDYFQKKPEIIWMLPEQQHHIRHNKTGIISLCKCFVPDITAYARILLHPIHHCGFQNLLHGFHSLLPCLSDIPEAVHQHSGGAVDTLP